MNLLAIDTTSDFGSVALVRDGHLVEEVALHSKDGFAHIIFGEIEKLLAKHQLGIRDMDVFASASGPGSFTGVRVGLSAVKGLAEATGQKVVAVSNLKAMAWYGTHPMRAVVLDARRGEIYGAVYDSDLELICEEVVAPLERWLAIVPKGELEFITSGIDLRQTGITAPIVEAPRALAGAIGLISADEYNRGLAKDPAVIDANYVRRSDAELLWKDPK